MQQVESRRISVAIVVRNEATTIENAIKSVLAQEGVTPHEILLVDSRSSDGTELICASYEDKYETIRHIVIPHKGIGYARKVAASKSSGEFVAFLDGDCRAPRNWLMMLFEGFQRNSRFCPKLAAVGGSHTPFRDADGFAALLGILKLSPLASGSSTYAAVSEVDRQVGHIPTANVMYLRSFLREVTFDESFAITGEDIDVSTRGILAGYTFAQIARSSVEHKMQPTLGRWIQSMQKYGYGRMQWMFKFGVKTPIIARFLLPFLLPILLIGLLPFGLEYTLVLVVLYGGVVIVESLRQSVLARKAYIFFHLCYLFPVTHCFFAVGQYRYIVAKIRRREQQWKTI